MCGMRMLFLRLPGKEKINPVHEDRTPGGAGPQKKKEIA